ncbi:MAG: 2-phosphosulfolactate phosphatase [Bacteroidota bacterium]
MIVDLYFSASQTDELQLRDRIVVVIDVLRAGTTIAMALQNGAKEIIPAASVESAVKLGNNLFVDVTLLGGERNAKTIEGFDLGNSPGEYSEQVVNGKSIIFTSENGSQAILKAKYAKRAVLGAFVNISRVVDFLIDGEEPIVLFCAGRLTNGFSLEDTLCGGMIVSKLLEKVKDIELTDSAVMARTLYRSHGKNILRTLQGSEHGRYLVSLGSQDDIKLCSGVDTVPVLPTLEGNAIRLFRESD